MRTERSIDKLLDQAPLVSNNTKNIGGGLHVTSEFAAELEIRMHKAERVLKLIDAISEFDLDGNIFWNRSNMTGNEDGLFINCNDCYAWACADAEPLTVEDIPELRKAYEDVVDDYDGFLLFISRKRKMRPQGAMYAHIDRKFWPLFDACGPARESGFGNPVGSDQIEEYVLKKEREKAAKCAS